MSSLWVGLAASAAATYCWRLFGVIASRKMTLDSALIQWVRAVATALISALVIRFVYAPSGLLAETELVSRSVALAISVIAYFTFGKRIEIGVASAAGALILFEVLSPS
jgi:branched-subunit amino acid transport protein